MSESKCGNKMIFLFTVLLLSDVINVDSFTPSFKLCYKQKMMEISLKSNMVENSQKQPTSPSGGTSNTCLHAIVYGWDDEDSDDTTNASTGTTFSYTTIDSEVGPDACPPQGLVVARSLTDDRSRMGSFARLAAAFSPPERGIGIKDIERVEVSCVRENSIELEAMLCEEMGCVRLSVPITFPNECDGDPNLGCAIQNLDTLDIRAETMVMHMQASMEELSLDNADLDELVALNDKMSLPTWWVSTDLDKALEKECTSIQSLLNEAEFHPEVVALAQDGMEKNANLGNGWEKITSDYRVQRAKVAAVGPSGICMKVAAIQQSEPGRGTQYLDVAYPFSPTATPIQDAAALRANVLGLIAAVETSTTSSPSTETSSGGNFDGMKP